MLQNHSEVQNLNVDKSKDHSYVIFDGSCGFCNYSAMFIAKKDVSDRFILVSNSSDFGKFLLTKHRLESISPSSIVLIVGEEISTKSKAIRTILGEIPGNHFLKFLLKITPVFFQNIVYDCVAKIRKYLPIKTTCSIPESKLKEKFRL